MFVGALRELEKNDTLASVECLAGSSAGALVAAMYALEYNVDKIYEIVQGINFIKFDDAFNPIRVLTHYGLYDGNYIYRSKTESDKLGCTLVD